VVLVILIVMWAAVLLPPWLRSRSEHRPSDSITTFRQQLSVLDRGVPGSRMRSSHRDVIIPPLRAVPGGLVVRGMSLQKARRRRRDILVGLVTLMVISLAAGFLVPSLRFMLVAHVVLDLAFVVYVGLLARAQQLAIERDEKVHFLPSAFDEGFEPLYANSAR